MNKQTIVNKIIKNHSNSANDLGQAFAPANIALVKYWGKRNIELNLPMTSSLSISLGNKGTTTIIEQSDRDSIILNGAIIDRNNPFATRLIAFINLLRPNNQTFYKITTNSNIPIAAGLASSASGFAALVKAFDNLYNWQLNSTELSILARLGSGSAARSVYDGFVKWNKGQKADGMDCFSTAITTKWPELLIGLLVIDKRKKAISSREAMNITTKTSTLYKKWPDQVEHDLQVLEYALESKDFYSLGETAESNSIFMHKTMHDSTPSINYDLPQTTELKIQIQNLRASGLNVFFTQDAGPNLKLLFTKKDIDKIKKLFPKIEVITPFLDQKFLI